MADERSAIPRNVFLLRKSRQGSESLVMKRSDFPFRFTVNGKRYVTQVTRKGGVITTAE